MREVDPLDFAPLPFTLIYYSHSRSQYCIFVSHATLPFGHLLGRYVAKLVFFQATGEDYHETGS